MHSWWGSSSKEAYEVTRMRLEVDRSLKMDPKQVVVMWSGLCGSTTKSSA
jgi:hypothetical protein